MDHPREVSVVITCHTELRLPSIIKAITSVQQQTADPVEIIVAVDHNPALAAQLEAQLPTVKVVVNDSVQRGAGATRNVGAFAARSEFIAFLDDDEVADPDWLELLQGPFSDPSVVGTGGRYLAAWATREPTWFPDIFAWVVGAHHAGLPQSAATVRNVWAGNMAVRRDSFTEAGGFATDFGKVGQHSQPEDTELCIRLARRTGGHWVYEPAAKIHHEVPLDRSTFRFFVQRCYSEGHGKVFLSEVLAGPGDTLADESAYLRRDIPRSLARELRRLPGSWRRIGAIFAGVAASGAGAVMATAQVRLTRLRTARQA